LVPSCVGLGRAALAQSAERLTRNEKVVGSIPTGGSNQKPQVRSLSVWGSFGL
jgi:hypothetical protein